MAIDVSVPTSRRALFMAALGGVAAAAANAIGRPAVANASDGFALVQGADNSGTTSTLVRSYTTTAFQGLADASSGTAYGLRGRSNSTAGAGVVGQVVAATGTNYGVRGLSASPNGRGVRGESPFWGVEGIATTGGASFGVFGYSPDTTSSGAGVFGAGPSRGVYALSNGNNGRGTYGVATGGGYTIGAYGRADSYFGTGVMGSCMALATTARGVYGVARFGVGVHAEATDVSGIALKVTGKAVFKRSGIAVVFAGASSVTVSGIPLTPVSLVIATIQGPGASGVYVRNVQVNAPGSSFTITLAKAVAVNTGVGWFIAN